MARNLDNLIAKINPNHDYTLRELSQITGVPENTLWYNVKHEKLPSRRLFKKHFVKGQDAIDHILKA